MDTFDTIGERVAFSLGARHLGCGTVRCGDADTRNMPAGATHGEILALVYEPDDGIGWSVDVSILWRNAEGDPVDSSTVAAGLDPDDLDSIAAAVVHAEEGAP